jgi:bacillithiol system protein YtxJ
MLISQNTIHEKAKYGIINLYIVMDWNQLTTASDIDEVKNKSSKKPVVIFKNSNRCSISHAVLNDLERDLKTSAALDAEFYMLDVVAYRPVSLQVAEAFKVAHQSPQLLIIKNGQCVFHDSHFGINLKDVKDRVDEKVI